MCPHEHAGKKLIQFDDESQCKGTKIFERSYNEFLFYLEHGLESLCAHSWTKKYLTFLLYFVAHTIVFVNFNFGSATFSSMSLSCPSHVKPKNKQLSKRIGSWIGHGKRYNLLSI